MTIIKTHKHGDVYLDTAAIVKYYEKLELILDIDWSSSGNIQARCPLRSHDDHDPSWGINARTSAFNCYGCGWSGNLVNLLIELEGQRLDKKIKYDNAIEAGLRISSDSNITSEIPAIVRQRAIHDNREFRYYPDSILDALEDKRDYYLERGISPQVCHHWQLKYSPDDKRYTIPVRDIKNHIIGFIGLADSEQRSKGYKKSLYSPGLLIRKTLLGINRYDICDNKDRVILTEGSVDCLKVASIAEQQIAVMAVLHSSLTHDQYLLLRDIGYKYVHVMSDQWQNAGDELGPRRILDVAGLKLFRSVVNRFDGNKVKVSRVEYEGSDPGDTSYDEIGRVIDKCISQS